MCRLPCLVKAASLEDAKEYDGLVVVSPGVESLVGELAFAKAAVDNALKVRHFIIFLFPTCYLSGKLERLPHEKY